MDLMTADESYTQLKAGREAERTLLRGFTTIRDAGGPVFGLKRAIDEGIVAGPPDIPQRLDDFADGRSRRLPGRL